MFAATCFATLGPLSREATALGLSTLAFVFWRTVVGAVGLAGLMAVLAAIGRVRPDRTTSGDGRTAPRPAGRLLAATAALTLLNLAIFAALAQTTIAVALAVFYVYPAMVTLLAAILGREPPDSVRILAMVLALAGLAFVLLAPAATAGAVRVEPAGVALALFAAGCQSIYVLIGAGGFGRLRAIEAAVWMMALAGVGYLLIAMLAGAPAQLFAPFTAPRLWPVVLTAGVLGAALPTLAFLSGLRPVGASRAAILMTLEPVIAVLLAAALLAERPVPLQLLGGLIVLVAGVLLQVSRPSRRPARASA